MSKVNVNIDEAIVTAVHKFRSSKGEGIDFYVEAKSSNCTVYLQIVLYDEEARSRMVNSIQKGDSVRVTGQLKLKSYQKSDATAGCSLVIERPEVFSIIAGRKNEQQFQHAIPNYSEEQTEHESRSANNILKAEDTLDESELPF